VPRPEREFLDASRDAETQERLARARGTALRRRPVGALAVFSVLALVASVLAVLQAREAKHASAEALSRQLAAESRLLATTDVPAAMRKAVDAYEQAPTEQARSQLLSLAGTTTFHGLLGGHDGEVPAMTVSPNGRRLASGGANGRLIVWDVAQRRPVHTPNAGAPIRDLVISPDGRLLAVAGEQGLVSIWRLEDGVEVARPAGHGGSVEALAFSPDGQHLVSVDDTRLAIVWETASFTERARMSGHGGPDSAVAISPDSATVAIAGDDGNVARYDVATGTPRDVLPTGGGPLHAVAFHPYDGSLIAGGEARDFSLWDRDGRYFALDTNFSGAVHDLAINPDGRNLYCGCGRHTMIWDLATRTHRDTVGTRTGTVEAVAASATGDLVASAGEDGATLLWERALLPMQHSERITDIAPSPDGRTLAAGGTEGLTLWNTSDRRQRPGIGDTGPVTALAYRGDGQLASAGTDRTICVWDAAALIGAGLPTVLRAHAGLINDLAFSPSQPLLVSAGADGRVLLWRLDNPAAAPIEILPIGPAVQSVAFAPDGRHLASSRIDGQIVLTDLADPARASTLDGGGGEIAISPDGRHLAAVAGINIHLHDLTRPTEPPAVLTGHTRPVQTIAFSPDGRFLASGSGEHPALLWDIRTRTPWATLTGHTDHIIDVAFGADGTLYTVSADRTVIPWTTDPIAALAELGTQLARGFPS
jgi:WD40 repeat protein